MERRVLVAIFLSFIVLYAYQAFVAKPAPKPQPSASQAAKPVTQGASKSAPVAAAAVQAAPVAAAAPLVADSTERDIRIETRDVIAVLTNRGARLKSWRLKKYLDQEGKPQELVENQLAAQPLPFTLNTSSAELDATLNNAFYSVGTPPTAMITSPLDVRFEYRDAAGTQAIKTFHFVPDSYAVTVRADVTAGTRVVTPAIVWGPAVGDIAEISRYTQRAEGLLFQAGKVQRLALKDLTKQPAYDGDFLFAGVDDNYFMT